LTDQTPAFCAKGQTQAEFLLAGGETRQQKIGNVGANNEKNYRTRAHENLQGRQQPALGAEMRLPQRQKRGSDSLTESSVELSHVTGEGGDLSLGLFKSDSLFQSGNAQHVAIVAILKLPIGIKATEERPHHVGDPDLIDLAGHGATKILRRNAD